MNQFQIIQAAVIAVNEDARYLSAEELIANAANAAALWKDSGEDRDESDAEYFREAYKSHAATVAAADASQKQAQPLNVIAVRHGKSVWTDGEFFVKSETRPDGLFWSPAYAKSRVHGSSYQAYKGGSEWEKSANKAMANAARANFEYSGKR